MVLLKRVIFVHVYCFCVLYKSVAADSCEIKKKLANLLTSFKSTEQKLFFKVFFLMKGDGAFVQYFYWIPRIPATGYQIRRAFIQHNVAAFKKKNYVLWLGPEHE